jgi:cysteinyl-tRNA synthetase
MWPFPKKVATVKFTNTLTGSKDDFKSITPGKVRLYSCGPTVYGPQHIGNLRAAVFSDILTRTLTSAGYDVEKVVNITDVGHLVGDGDEGEDKMAVGAAREQVSPKAIADKYTEQYLKDIRALNIDTTHIHFPRATEFIQEQIAMIQTLEKRGHTYVLEDGVYFDTATFLEYGKLGNQQGVAIEAGARVDIVEGKKNSRDFVLWRVAKPNDLQKWPSPWGEGNPGWSIECSAMATTILGKTIDIHTGGEDHIAVHHNNEIAQSEGATGQPFAYYWLHNAFLTIDGQKISKSLGNIYTLDDIQAKGIHPLALRSLFLNAHYRSPLSFSWESLISAHSGLTILWTKASKAKKDSAGHMMQTEQSKEIVKKIQDSLRGDLNTSYAVALLFSDTLDLKPGEQWYVFSKAEELLGLSLTNPPAAPVAITVGKLPEEVRALAAEREEARKNKDFGKSDELRIHLLERGYAVEDTPSGTTYTKI